MGSNQSRGRQERVITVNHPRFKDTKLVTNGTAASMETSILADEKSYERWRSSIDQHRIKAQNYRFLLLPLHETSFQKGVCCGNRKSFRVTYDKFPFVLSDAIDAYKARNTCFQQPELWHLLYAIAAAEEEYAKATGNQSKIGDIKPQNVFLSDKGKIKLANPLSWPELPLGRPQEHVTYLAPEQMQNLRTKNADFSVESGDSEQFAIGLTVLSAGILKQNSDLYDFKKMTFDMKEATKRMNFWLTRQKYSENLRILVAYLCNFNLSGRYNIPELWRWLSAYRAKIGAHQLQGTTITLPDRFKQQVAELKTTSPYFTEYPPRNYSNEYYSDYQMVDVLKQQPSATYALVDDFVPSGSNIYSPRGSRINKSPEFTFKATQSKAIVVGDSTMEQTKVDIAIPGETVKTRKYKIEKSIIDVHNPNFSKMNMTKEGDIPISQILQEAQKVKIGNTESYTYDPYRPLSHASNVNNVPATNGVTPHVVETLLMPSPKNIAENIKQSTQNVTPSSNLAQKTKKQEINRALSNQPQVAARPQTKFVSPPAGSNVGTIAKKPNIRFTYGKGQTTTNTNAQTRQPATTLNQKQSTIKSPQHNNAKSPVNVPQNMGTVEDDWLNTIKRTRQGNVTQHRQRAITQSTQNKQVEIVKEPSGDDKMNINVSKPGSGTNVNPQSTPEAEIKDIKTQINRVKPEEPVQQQQNNKLSNLIQTNKSPKHTSGVGANQSSKLSGVQSPKKLAGESSSKVVGGKKNSNSSASSSNLGKNDSSKSSSKKSFGNSAKYIDYTRQGSRRQTQNTTSMKEIKEEHVAHTTKKIQISNTAKADRKQAGVSPTVSLFKKQDNFHNSQASSSKPSYNGNPNGVCKFDGHHHEQSAANATHLHSTVDLPHANVVDTNQKKIQSVKQIQPNMTRKAEDGVSGIRQNQKQAKIHVSKPGEVVNSYDNTNASLYPYAPVQPIQTQIVKSIDTVYKPVQPKYQNIDQAYDPYNQPQILPQPQVPAQGMTNLEEIKFIYDEMKKGTIRQIQEAQDKKQQGLCHKKHPVEPRKYPIKQAVQPVMIEEPQVYPWVADHHNTLTDYTPYAQDQKDTVSHTLQDNKNALQAERPITHEHKQTVETIQFAVHEEKPALDPVVHEEKNVTHEETLPIVHDEKHPPVVVQEDHPSVPESHHIQHAEKPNVHFSYNDVEVQKPVSPVLEKETPKFHQQALVGQDKPIEHDETHAHREHIDVKEQAPAVVEPTADHKVQVSEEILTVTEEVVHVEEPTEPAAVNEEKPIVVTASHVEQAVYIKESSHKHIQQEIIQQSNGDIVVRTEEVVEKERQTIKQPQSIIKAINNPPVDSKELAFEENYVPVKQFDPFFVKDEVNKADELLIEEYKQIEKQGSIIQDRAIQPEIVQEPAVVENNEVAKQTIIKEQVTVAVQQEKPNGHEDTLLIHQEKETVQKQQASHPEERPAVQQEMLIVHDQKPGINEEAPAVHEEILIVNGEKPTPIQEEPVINEEILIAHEEKPKVQEKVPVYERKVHVEEEQLLINEEALVIQEPKPNVQEEQRIVEQKKVVEEVKPYVEQEKPVAPADAPAVQEEVIIKAEEKQIVEVKTIIHQSPQKKPSVVQKPVAEPINEKLKLAGSSVSIKQVSKVEEKPRSRASSAVKSNKINNVSRPIVSSKQLIEPVNKVETDKKSNTPSKQAVSQASVSPPKSGLMDELPADFKPIASKYSENRKSSIHSRLRLIDPLPSKESVPATNNQQRQIRIKQQVIPKAEKPSPPPRKPVTTSLNKDTVKTAQLDAPQSKVDVQSQARSSRLNQSELRRKFSRSASRHHDFQHEGHYDIKYIEQVPDIPDGNKSLRLSAASKYIKDRSEAGKSEVVQHEREILKHNKFDIHAHHQYYERHEIKFHHDGTANTYSVYRPRTRTENFQTMRDVVRSQRQHKKSQIIHESSKQLLPYDKDNIDRVWKEPFKRQIKQGAPGLTPQKEVQNNNGARASRQSNKNQEQLPIPSIKELAIESPAKSNGSQRFIRHRKGDLIDDIIGANNRINGRSAPKSKLQQEQAAQSRPQSRTLEKNNKNLQVQEQPEKQSNLRKSGAKVRFQVPEENQQSGTAVTHNNLLTTDQTGSKIKTKSQKYDIVDDIMKPARNSPRKTENFTNPKGSQTTNTKPEPEGHIDSMPKTNLSPKANEGKKEEAKDSPQKLVPRKPRTYNTDAIDDLLGFGRPKKSVPPKEQPAPVKNEEVWKPQKPDRFIEQVKQTNRKVNKDRFSKK